MRMSNLLMPTLREVPAEAEITSHKLMLRAGLIRKLAAGIYSYLPLGLRTLQKVEQIVREEMDNAGAQELLMSALLPAEAYQASGRWEVFGPSMFKMKDRNDRDFCLGPTHEELFTQTVIDSVRSYKEYPMTLYQIQHKYRDEGRPRFGIIRSREFIMKDAYSFDLTEEGLDKSYQKMYDAYCRIFNRLGLDFTIVDADSGAMGGSGSQEFMVKSPIGEDGIAYCDDCGCVDDLELAEPFMVRQITNAEVGFAGPVGLDIPVYVDKEVAMMKNFIVGANETDMHYKNVNINKDFTPTEVADIRTIETGDVCPKCGKPIKTAQGIEVGHIFKLGTKYSDALGLKSLDETGKSKTVIMGCYGIGVTRCLAAAIEQNNDENGIIWPVSIAPYHAIVIPVNSKNEEQSEIAEKVYNDLKVKGIEVLLDDRNERAGVKFKDADLIGIPVRIVVGKKCGEGVVEYKERTAENAVEKNIDDAVNDVVEFINNNR